MDLNGLDKFKLITYQSLDIDERNVFTLLYQPIMILFRLLIRVPQMQLMF